MTEDYTALVERAARAICDSDGVDADGEIYDAENGLIIDPAWRYYESAGRAVAGVVSDAIASLERQLAEVMGERDERYIPGEFRCAKCGFMLSQFRLRASDGAIGSRDDPGEKCPNDNSPLWRVTWRERAGEHYERAVSEMQRATTTEAERDRLAARCGELERALRDIAESDDIDNALDPERNKRVARAAIQEPQT